MRHTAVVIGAPPQQPATLLRWLSRFLLLTGMLALGYVTYSCLSAYVFQETAVVPAAQPLAPDQLLKPDRPSAADHFSASAEPAMKPPMKLDVPSGSVLGRIEINRLGLSAIFVQGDSDSILSRAVGHIPDTAMPGEHGNIALAGHRDTFFRALRKIRQGDVVTLETGSGEYEYAVESTSIVSPNATEVLRSSSQDELTLITCYPFSYFGSAPDRFIVRARKLQAPDN